MNDQIRRLAEETARLAKERYAALGLLPGEGSRLSPQAGAYQDGLRDALKAAIRIDASPPSTEAPEPRI
jgi:hypothetical protein